MSETGPAGVDWAVSLGSILGIIVSITVAAGAAWRIIAYVRSRVAREVVETREKLTASIANLQNQVKENRDVFQESIEDKVRAGDKRYDEMRYLFEKLQEKSENDDKELKNKLEVYREERNQVFHDMRDQTERYRVERNEAIGEVHKKLELFRQERNDRLGNIEEALKRIEGYIPGEELKRWLERIDKGIEEHKEDYAKLMENFETLRKQYYDMSVMLAKMDKKVNGDTSKKKAPV